jgi:lipoyl(octanoyl) transferase
MTWRLITYRPCNAFENMAIDEAIFRETIKNQKPPTLRFFGWHPSAISIGYFQDLKKEINVHRCRLSSVDVVRRITGGKAVYHRDDITYSLTAGKTEKLFPDNIIGTYEKISLCLARGLSFLGIHAQLAKVNAGMAVGEPDMSPACFSTPSGNELLVAGRKICGSAQTRTQGGFLQHGSLMITFDPMETAALILSTQAPEQSEKLRRAVTSINEIIPSPVSTETIATFLQRGFSDELGITLTEEPLTPEEKVLSRQLVKKYQSDVWNWKRKKEGGQ